MEIFSPVLSSFHGSRNSSQPQETFVDLTRIDELNKITNSPFDLSRLIKFIQELNMAYFSESYLSCILLIRAIIDHVPPIFGQCAFAGVANNYGGAGKSFRDSALHLENSSRKIADAYLHSQLRAKESLPTKVQVEFRADVDLLLAEIVRITDRKT